MIDLKNIGRQLKAIKGVAMSKKYPPVFPIISGNSFANIKTIIIELRMVGARCKDKYARG